MFSHSLTLSAVSFCASVPLLCKEGQGEVEDVAGTAQPYAPWTRGSTPPAFPLRKCAPLQRGGEKEPFFLVPTLWAVPHSVNE